MQTHREEEEEEEVSGLQRKSAEIVREGFEILPSIVEGEARESEPWGSLPLIVRPSEEETGFDKEFAEDFMQGLRLEPIAQEVGKEDEGDEEEEEEFEFAFVCENPDGSMISAEEAFQDGQIKPFYPVFGRNIFLEEDAFQSSSSVLRRILVEERVGNPSSSSLSSSSLYGGDPLEGLAEGTYCVWRMGRAGKAGDDVKGMCRKSNSTGYSKLWKVKDLVMRSNSNGKDAFVFLNPKKAKENTETKSAAKSNVGKAKAVTIAARKGGHHSHRSDKNPRRSYLPYKVGFFTNFHGMSRNVHPY